MPLGALAPEHHDDGLQKKLDVVRQTQLTDVFGIEAKSSAKIARAAKLGKLERTGEAGTHPVTGMVDEVGSGNGHKLGPWSDKTHIALNYVEQLRQFVEAELTHKPSD